MSVLTLVPIPQGDQPLSLPLLFSFQLEVLRPLQRDLDVPLALEALHTQHDLLGGLGLFPQDGFGLSAESLLLPVVTPPALSSLGLLGHVRGIKFTIVFLNDSVNNFFSI